MSSNTDYYLNKVKELESNPVAAYQSQYGTQMNELMNKITNRQPFSYDFNADPLYQSYKDNYTKLGKEASMNAVANASALTGGYGNSYATTAGAQANQQYLTQLNNIIPELFDAALTKYNDEGEDLQNQYNNLRNLENDAYSKYQQDLDQYNTALNYYQNAYANQMSNDQWASEYALSAAKAASGSESDSGSDSGNENNTRSIFPIDPDYGADLSFEEEDDIFNTAKKMYSTAQSKGASTAQAQKQVANYLARLMSTKGLAQSYVDMTMRKIFG